MNIKKIIEKAKRYKSVIIFGYDRIGINLYSSIDPLLRSNNIPIFFCDNNVDKQKLKNVYSVKVAVEKFQQAVFIVTSISHLKEMRQQIIELGVLDKDIIEYSVENTYRDRETIVKTVNVPVLYGNLLEGKTAIITGGNRGIGLSIANAFVRNGASVIILGRNIEKIQKSVNELKKINANVVIKGIQFDVTDFDNLDDTLDNIFASVAKIDILVNNAGIIGKTKLGHIDVTEFDSVINTNLKSMTMISQKVASYMKLKGICGNILNVLSTSSYRPANSPYMLSKWGARGLTLGLAKTLIPYGIVVNGIAPGPTATDMMMGDEINIQDPCSPVGRYAKPEEVANLAVVMVSELGRLIVGDIVCMGGGVGVLTFDDMEYPFID